MDKKTITFFVILIVFIFVFSLVQESSLTGKLSWNLFKRTTIRPTVPSSSIQNVYTQTIGDPIIKETFTCYSTVTGKEKECNLKNNDVAITKKDYTDKLYFKATEECENEINKKCEKLYGPLAYADVLNAKLQVLVKYGFRKDDKSEYCLLSIKYNMGCKKIKVSPETKDLFKGDFQDQ